LCQAGIGARYHQAHACHGDAKLQGGDAPHIPHHDRHNAGVC
jgi:hypothetical protein